MITDKNSGLDEGTIKSAAKPLHQNDVRIIAFSIGREGNTKELENLTPYEDDVKKVTENEDPSILAREIMKMVLRGKNKYSFVFYYTPLFFWAGGGAQRFSRVTLFITPP